MTNKDYILEDIENGPDFKGKEEERYLIRKALEDKANESFVNSEFDNHFEVALSYEKTLRIEPISYS